MAKKTNTIIPSVVFHTFKGSLGSVFDKVCNDAKSMLGRWEDDFLKSSLGGWKATSTGKLKSKEGHEIQMPLNNPMSCLIRFGMQINEVADNMGVLKLNEDNTKVLHHGIESQIPAYCKDWIESQRAELKQSGEKAKDANPTKEDKDKESEKEETEKA